MKVLTASQIRLADQVTIQGQGISSFELMQRAAGKCADSIRKLFPPDQHIIIVCGRGNNGGDGYCITENLFRSGYRVSLLEVETSSEFSADCMKACSSVEKCGGIEKVSSLTTVPASAVIVDALFGTGINRPVSGSAMAIIRQINESGCIVVSIDLPSGMPADPIDDIAAYPIVKADHTLTFQCPKLSLLLPGSGVFTGEMTVLDIGLDQPHIDNLPDRFVLTDETDIRKMIRPRERFSHKGTYGHALLIAGSRGKGGAAILAAKGCLRSGAGLLTVHLPECCYIPMQTAVPEAMVSIDKDEDVISNIPDLRKFNAIGAGPGIGTEPETINALKLLLQNVANQNIKLVLDADALNILSAEPEMLQTLPKGTILTPHPGEFRRLAGSWSGDKEMLEKAVQFAKDHCCILVLKGHRTLITDGNKTWFNSTGNPGMAKGGSGDVLTGLITGLCASGYPPMEAAIAGVYFHGQAGDQAAKTKGQTSMTAGDLCDEIRVERG